MKKKYLLIIFLLFISPAAVRLYSHPHLFIKPTVEFIKTGQKRGAIKIKWEWDKWWSRDIIRECDINKDGFFDKNETKLVYDDFFIGIKKFNYFMEIRLNGKRLNFNSVSNFSASVDSNKIASYTFIIPIKPEITDPMEVAICFNDKTIYAAFDKEIILSANNDFTYSRISIKDSGYYGRKIVFDISKRD